MSGRNKKNSIGFGILLAAIVCLLSIKLTAKAGGLDQGGGTGILSNGQIVLLELAEQGVEGAPYVPNLTPDPNIMKTLEASFNAPDAFKQAILPALAAKLTDIDQGAHPAGIYMAAAFAAYTIEPVPHSLTAIDDVDSPIGDPKIQLAERRGDQIFIDTTKWAQMDQANQVALLTHEIAYALQPSPDRDHQERNIFRRLLSSTKARFLNGFFYRTDWRATWPLILKKEMEDANATNEYGDAGNDVQDASGGSPMQKAYNYLYGAMAANKGNSGHVIGMKATTHNPYDSNYIPYDPASGATAMFAPIFSDLHVSGEKMFGGKDAGELLTSSTKADLTLLCQKSEFRETEPQMKPATQNYLTYDMMYFVEGKVILRSLHNDLVIFLNSPTMVGACVTNVTKIQRSWFQ